MLVPAQQLKRRTAARLIAIVVVGIAIFGTLSPSIQASWPERIGPAAWPTVRSGSYQYHVQPPVDATELPSAEAFQTEFGPLFDSAGTLAASILAVPAPETIDVYAYANPALFQAATTSRPVALSRHMAVAADLESGSILINAPELLALSTTQVEDAIRNAVTQLAVQRAAAGVALSGFATGIALYVELPPSEYLAKLASTVQTAAQQDTLLTWFDLNRPVAATDRELALAESYAIVSFLIDRYDIPTLRAFLAELPKAESWQAAMRTVYAVDAATIEQQWRDDLPRWTTSGWRDNLIAAFDLEPARALLAQGQYVAAKAVLDPSLNLYRQLNDPEALADAQALMSEADTGIQAEALMIEVESALQAHDYSRASNLLDQAEIQYASLPSDQTPNSLLSTYRQLATDGLTASTQLARAAKLADSWGKYPEARAAARDAGATFARLGDDANRTSAEQVLDRLDSRQRRLVVLVGCLGVMTLLWLALWVRARGPGDVKWG
jgi:hypothetical protein